MTPKPPTQAQLASALHLTPRRIRQLITEGLPIDSLESALEWRATKTTGGDSAEQLRIERIGLVKSQKTKIDLQNRISARELIPIGEAQEAAHRVCAVARGRLLKMAADLPPQLEGLSAAAMQSIVRDAVTDILTELSNDLTYQ